MVPVRFNQAHPRDEASGAAAVTLTGWADSAAPTRLRVGRDADQHQAATGPDQTTGTGAKGTTEAVHENEIQDSLCLVVTVGDEHFTR